MKKFLAGCAIAALATSAVYAQETTSGIRGTVTAGGQPVANATVTIVSEATGSRSTLTTDASGGYSVSGLRPGGPYTVTVNAPGFPEARVTDVNTVVAQAFELPIELQKQAEIVVTASRVKGAGTIAQGPTTVLRAADVALVASANRDIRDLERRDPFARLDDTPTGGRAVSFAGQNPRYNRFTVDGVPITDNFGLNTDGLPSRRSPIPFDAIGQFQAKVAPYDVREGNFQGGTINIVLRSGTNEFQGSGFYARSGDGFQGDRTKDRTINVPKYKVDNYGAELSGPIVRDKIFFMIAGERLRGGPPLTEGPVDNNVGTPINGITQAQVDQVVSIAKSKYSYDAGGVLHESGDKDDRLVGKLDFNLSDKHRLSLTGTYAKDAININSSNTFTTAPTGLGLSSNAYIQGNKLWTGVGQLNSQWTDEFSTEVRGYYKKYTRLQQPLLGNNFAQFKICDAPTSDRFNTGVSPTSTTEATGCQAGFGTISIGPDNSRQTNLLHTSTWGGLVQARLTRDDHDVRLFAEYTSVKTYDAFLQNSAGNYYFDSISDFQAGNAQSLTYANAIPSLNPLDAAAVFNYQTYTFGLSDRWRVQPNLTLTYGVRYDLYGTSNSPVLNTVFQQRYGFSNIYTISGKGVFQPRLSLDYKPTPKLSISAGGGIFGGATPDVYLVNSFQNTGILSNSVTVRQQANGQYSGTGVTQALGSAILTNVNGSKIPTAANTLLSSAAVSGTSSVNALDPNFKLPSQWRASLSATYDLDLGRLGDHWRVGGDVLFLKVRNQLFFTDLRSVPLAGALTPDGRQRYIPRTTTVTGAPNFSDSNSDIELTNTSKGRSVILVGRVDKDFDIGLNVFGSFTYESVKDQTPNTSSTASSNYLNAAFVDANRASYGISNDQIKYFFKYGLTYNHAFFGDYKTIVSLFGESRIGHPYSYTFQDPSSGRSAVFGTSGSGTTGTSGSRYLLYVPTVGGDTKVSYESATFQQAFENFVQASGLGKYQGQIAPRNAFHSKWFTRIDLHASQEIPTGLGHSRITLFGDIENFTNLLNKNWGQISEYVFPYNVPTVRVQCLVAPIATGTAPTGSQIAQNPSQACAQYRYSSVTGNGFQAPSSQVYVRQSLFTIRVGARISF